MKLNWFSPLPPAKTDVAHFTARVLTLLQSRADITLWTDQTEWDQALSKQFEIRRYQPDQILWDQLNAADLSIYNIGNNPQFHQSIWQMSRRHPGIVILHDTRLHHFFHGVYRSQNANLSEYLSQMYIHHGERGLQDAAKFIKNGGTNVDYMAEHYPLTSIALENALGTIVHSSEFLDVLRAENRRLVAYAPLPFPAAPRQRSNQKESGPPFRLICFGYIGPNRRLERFIEAWAKLPEKNLFRLDIYGEIRNERNIRELVQPLGLENFTRIHGFVSEEELKRALDRAHLAVNMRYPTVGEASGSQLRIWNHALPSIVTRTGWYASISEEAVAHVSPENELADIQRHLKDFLAAPERFARMGERGRQILKEEHAPEKYVATLLEMAERAVRFRPQVLAFNMADRIGVEMSAWIRTPLSNELFKRIAEEIYLITNAKQHSS